MRFLNALWIWICLSGIWPSADGRSEQHYEQNKIFISCSHKWASKNIKYFCRDPCRDRDILVRSDQSPKGRFALKDYGTGTFNVTISGPQQSDSGIYWCGVKRVGVDTYERVRLNVPKSKKNANQPSTPQPEATGSQSSTTRSSSLTSEGNTTSSSTTGFEGVVESSRLPYGNAAQSRRLMTPAALTVMVIISGTVFCMCYIQKRKSHSSNADAESQVTTCTTEAAEGEETQQQIDTLTNATIYSTVNKTNQIPDPPLYSTISTPAEPRRSKRSVTYAHVHIQEKPRTSVLSENTTTYDTVCFPKTTL